MYQWRKGIAHWVVGTTLYISVPFTWLMDDAEKLAQAHKGPVFIGGPGTMKPTSCLGFEPILFHNPAATFTTRGCPNQCAFCAVPKIEGEFVEIPAFRPAPVVCDNNLLASSKIHLNRVVEKLKVFPFVDFNQGLEARRFTPEIADLFSKLNCKIRFAFDNLGSEKFVKEAVDLSKKRTTKNISIYVLIGFRDTPENARYRLEKVRSWGVLPNAMRYQPLDATCKNTFVSEGWTEKELKRMARYYNRLNWTSSIPYDEFGQEPAEENTFLGLFGEDA